MSSVLDNLPSVIPRQELKLDDVQSVQGDRESKPIIIAHSRPLEQGEKDLLRGYGTHLELRYRNGRHRGPGDRRPDHQIAGGAGDEGMGSRLNSRSKWPRSGCFGR